MLIGKLFWQKKLASLWQWDEKISIQQKIVSVVGSIVEYWINTRNMTQRKYVEDCGVKTWVKQIVLLLNSKCWVKIIWSDKEALRIGSHWYCCWLSQAELLRNAVYHPRIDSVLFHLRKYMFCKEGPHIFAIAAYISNLLQSFSTARKHRYFRA